MDQQDFMSFDWSALHNLEMGRRHAAAACIAANPDWPKSKCMGWTARGIGYTADGQQFLQAFPLYRTPAPTRRR